MLKNKIIITGSKGLIGSSLKNSLRRIGYQVHGIDNAFKVGHVEYGDIQDYALLESLALKCTGIVHLAGTSRVIDGEKNPSDCWKNNVEGTQKVLNAASNSPNNPWIIYASSREVYGQQEALPVKEDSPLIPLNIYARSKVAAEKLVSAYRSKGLQTSIVRFSNVYGSIKDHSDRVIPAFCRTAALGGTIRIDGGQNVFDFTHIDDVTNGVIRIIEKLQAKHFDLPAIHFTSGQGTTLLQAAKLAASISRKNINFSYAPSRSFDVNTFYGDPTRAEHLLGWKAKTSIQEGMSKFITDFIEHHSEVIA